MTQYTSSGLFPIAHWARRFYPSHLDQEWQCTLQASHIHKTSAAPVWMLQSTGTSLSTPFTCHQYQYCREQPAWYQPSFERSRAGWIAFLSRSEIVCWAQNSQDYSTLCILFTSVLKVYWKTLVKVPYIDRSFLCFRDHVFSAVYTFESSCLCSLSFDHHL